MSEGNGGYRWSKFWWQDWASDPALRACSLAARGLWIELLCIMHVAVPRGHLLVNGKPPTARQLAAQTGATLKEIGVLLGELKDAGVYSHDLSGAIYSRRMVRDTAASEQGKRTGQLGGNPNLGRKANWPHPTEGVNPPRYPPPLTTPVNSTRYPARLTPPVYPESEAESEVQRREEVKKNKPLTFPELSSARGAAAANRETPDALKALLGEADDHYERLPPDDRISDNPAVAAHVRRAAKSCKMTIPYGEVRSVEAQLDALQAQPQAVGADMTMGLRWQAAEPVRSVEQQIAAALADATPEQIAKAAAYGKVAA